MTLICYECGQQNLPCRQEAVANLFSYQGYPFIIFVLYSIKPVQILLLTNCVCTTCRECFNMMKMRLMCTCKHVSGHLPLLPFWVFNHAFLCLRAASSFRLQLIMKRLIGTKRETWSLLSIDTKLSGACTPIVRSSCNYTFLDLSHGVYSQLMIHANSWSQVIVGTTSVTRTLCVTNWGTM